MTALSVAPSGPLRGTVVLPGDKSISHRALILGALATATTRIRGLSAGEDVARTLEALRRLGVAASREAVTGGPWRAAGALDCGNSGTTARLLLGALAPRADATLSGDASLSRRPMRRVCAPLREMGAAFSSGDTLPITVTARPLRGADLRASVPSAQVKSAVLLAGLGAEGRTTYTETLPTRDHTERMLVAMGARLSVEAGRLTLEPGPLRAIEVDVPRDLSAAAFWLVAAAIVPGSELVLRGVGVNPTRAGVLAVLRRMGATVEVDPEGDPTEPRATLTVRSGPLSATTIGGAEIPTLIDELPVLAVAAAFATGETVIRDAAELRVKESDRIATTVAGLRALGVEAEATDDGMVIVGDPDRAPAALRSPLPGPPLSTAGDHRIAMAFLVAGLRLGATVDDTSAIATSDPHFLNTLGGFARVS